jgi:ABC-2 type transport system ATP-binding protein
MVKNLNELGKTIFLTTHYMDEAQFLADRVAIIVDGKIVAEGTPDSLTAGLAVESRATYSVSHEDAGRLEELARAENIELRPVESAKPSLEDVYLELTKGSTSEAHE